MTEKFVSPEQPPEGLDRELLECLAEELSELIIEAAQAIQRVQKAQRFGLREVQPGQGLTNIQRISEEIGDIQAVVCRLGSIGLVDYSVICVARDAKEENLNRYLQSL